MLGKALLTAATGMMAEGEALGVEDVFSTFLYTGNGGGQKITNGIALADGVAIAPGTALGGGFFAGFISATADGVATHALIVAPRATGATGTGYTLTTNLQWKTSLTSTPNTTSPFDGAANTAAMIAAGAAAHPAAQFCNNLTIGGFSDWYLPARYELDIAYFNLKPTTGSNNTSWGINDYSVPKRTTNYSPGAPLQTSIAAFQSGGGEDFVAAFHWSSTEASASTAWRLDFSNGNQANFLNKDITFRVRAFRKIAINDPALDPYRVTGEGGLVWLKNRTLSPSSHALYDTIRGRANALRSNSTAGNDVTSDPTRDLVSFNADGFTLGANSNQNINNENDAIVSWTFRKAPKFFDVVTYAGDNASVKTIAHSLGSTPGCIIIKKTNSSQNWFVYHRGLSPSATTAIFLNSSGSAISSSTDFGSTDPTSSNFYVGNSLNQLGALYVAYIFAHDAGGFGEDGNQNVISCGSYTGNGSTTGPVINLGWEPQWVLIKRTDGAGSWFLYDNLRGLAYDSGVKLSPDRSDAEAPTNLVRLLPTGFTLYNISSFVNASGGNYIYIAIRRGPMKTPTDATKVFSAITYAGDSTASRVISGLINAPDWVLYSSRNAAGQGNKNVCSRLQGGGKYLLTESTLPETSSTAFGVQIYGQTSVTLGTATTAEQNASGTNYILYGLGRAPGFFDVVASNSYSTTQAHSLGVAPELIISKDRGQSSHWGGVVKSGSTGVLNFSLNLSNAFSNQGYSQSNVFSATTFNALAAAINVAGGLSTSSLGTVYYLFATVPGVSKVGSYTGTGTTLNIDCGFTSGARFALIKRTDSTGDWYVWDSARGIVAANDPYLLLNSTAAEVTSTDYIDPLSSGFQISSTAPAAINANGGSFIFLAIA